MATCKSMATTSHGAYQGDNPINFSLPLLMIQICFILALTRTIGLFMKPLRQPRVVAEIIGGILLGPSAFGRNQDYMNKIFPAKSISILDTIANLGLLFFLFMVGLELDLNAVLKTGKQALVIAAAGISVPFAAGIGVSVVLHHTIEKDGKFSAFLVFMGVAISITAFPVLARILAERKLLTTDVGQMAMSAAAVNDVVAWILLALAVALSGNDTSPTVAIWVLLTGVGYLIVMFMLVKPIMQRVAQHVTAEEPVKEILVCIIFAGVLASGFVTDVIGIHSIFGAFVYGLVIPKDGPLAKILIEKVEDFVLVLMLPLYFVSSGLKTNIQSIHGARSFGLTILVIAAACAGKILGTFAVSVLYGMSPRKGLTLGFLMNTKGLVELIVLNIGKERGVLNDETFAIMVIMALVTTFITTPVVMAIYKPARNQLPYTLRKLDMCGPNDELRMFACVHGIKNVPGIISLGEQARGTSTKFCLRMYILHLVELSERSSAIVMVHKARKDGRPVHHRGKTAQDHIYVAFEAFGHLSKVKVRPMTAISGFSDMHEDICSTAAEKRAAIIILPFHKHYHPEDGSLETVNAGFQQVNGRVLQHAPCSVGILVDRNLGGGTLDPSVHLVMTSTISSYNVAVFFFGGPDDREALALGCRMAQHPGVKLKVVHFISPGTAASFLASHRDAAEKEEDHGERRSVLKTLMGTKSFRRSASEGERHHHQYKFAEDSIDLKDDKKFDEEMLRALPTSNENDSVGEDDNNNKQITYQQKFVIHDPVETATESIKESDLNLVLTGRAVRPSELIASLKDRWIDYEELGPIGSALAASDLEIKASVLVVQQYFSRTSHHAQV